MSDMLCTRIINDSPLHDGDAGIRRRFAIEDAAWIWHPAVPVDGAFALRFSRRFRSDGTPIILHLSADERYRAYCNGVRFSRGPHRGDLEHWPFASYRLELPAGEHELMVVVTMLRDMAPDAQISNGGGFILRAEGSADAELSTGTAAWQVALCTDIETGPTPDPCQLAVGGETTIGYSPEDDPAEAVEAVVLRQGVYDNPHGIARLGWRLTPSPLPDMHDRPIRPGAIVAAHDGRYDGQALPAAWGEAAALAPWAGLIQTGSASIAAGQSVVLLWDLGRYHCGWPQLRCRGGQGARLTWRWAEALMAEYVAPGTWSRRKGDRAAWQGMYYFGAGDSWTPRSNDAQRWCTPWWRAGRFCLLEITAGAQALELDDLAVIETHYPLAWQGDFDCGDAELGPVLTICERVLQMCAHETYMDCPYYEQLMYVGDTRLQQLVTFVMDADDRLPKRALELFDYSRKQFGVVNERYPSEVPQHCMTFSLIWNLMLRDFAWWRDDLAFVAARALGMRAQLEQFRPYLNGDGLLESLPGWSFMDWVPAWHKHLQGCPPDGRTGVSSVINLLYVHALVAAADVEATLGEDLLAERYRRQAHAVRAALQARFWNPVRALFADDLTQESYSEHAQCLAILTDCVPDGQTAACYAALCAAEDLHRCTVYFSSYLLETHYRMGHGERIHQALDFWKHLVAQGFTTTVESPEPSRSDCHAWGAHPLHHCYASLAGIRPAAPGFAAVRVAPQPGALPLLRGSMPHPQGTIAFDLTVADGRITGSIDTPVPGVFCWDGEERSLVVGRNAV